MKILADESVDAPIVVRLRAEGHDIESVAEMAPGISDDVVLDSANARGAILLTADKDFGELVFRLHRVTQGVILIRLAGLSLSLKGRIVSGALRSHSQDMQHHFTVIEPASVRFRRPK